MTVDIRAKVYCSLGKVISGSVSDSYIQGEGLIYTKGTIVLDGLRTPARGTLVGISFAKNGRMIKLPRAVYVLSSFADPYRRQTTISLGCYLTVLSEESFGETTLKAAQTKPDVPCEVFNTINLGMEAKDIANEILSKVGLSGSAYMLTNHFSIDEFVIPSQPLSVLSDLLVSEGYVGCVIAGSALDIRVNDPVKGPSINTNEIIDIGPINSGPVPGDRVVVKYSTVKLGEPPEEETDEERAKRNWEWEETFGPLTEVSVSWYDEEASIPTEVVRKGYYKPYSFSATTYDQYDRAVTRINYDLSVLAETNNRYCTDVIRYGIFAVYTGDFADTLSKITPKVSFTHWDYKIPSKGGTTDVDLYEAFKAGGISAVKSAVSVVEDPNKTALECLLEQEGIEADDLSVVLQERTVTYITETELAGTLNLNSYTYVTNPSSGVIRAIDLSTELDVLESVTTVYYEKDEASGISKTSTAQKLIYAKTTTGQQDLATMVKNAQENEDPDQLSFWIQPILAKALKVVSNGVEQRIRTEREYGVQKRPSQANRNLGAYGKTPITGTPESVQEFAGSYGKGTVEFQLPYGDDDKISWSTSAGFSTRQKSKVQEKAAAYGRIQNWFLFGNRYGVSITLPAELMPHQPYMGIMIKGQGDFFGVNYMTNGTTYSFDENGIVASSDLLGFGVPI